jgi:hypothetical protein
MSNGVIAFLLGAGLSAWVYSQIYRRTGGNTQNAIIVAAIAGVLAFLAALIILDTFFK